MGEMCFSCFSQLAKGGACPHCGYDPSEDKGKYPAALKPGTVLNGRYILGRVLGQGGFGITYAAQDFETKQRVAIKEYLPTSIASREVTGQVSSFGTQQANFEHGKDGFMEEANALVDFKNNSHIVNVYDLFEANGTVYFVMEFVQGTNLKSYVKMMGGRLGEEAANHILLPIMEALEEVHAKGLVHRDIAPDNIIVTADNSAKLIDFGAARYSTGEKSLSLDVVLKHGYAPKEQYLRRGRQGPFTDVYAMAATYYYAVTGRVPPDSLQRMEEEELVSPSAFGARLSPHVDDALMKALEVQPADRYQSMGEFARAIKGIENEKIELTRIETVLKPSEPPKPAAKEAPPNFEIADSKPIKKGKKPLIFTIVAVMAVLAVVIGFTQMQPKKTADAYPSEAETAEPETSEPETRDAWVFDEATGTLTISGQGAMEETIPGYTISVPWNEFSDEIKYVNIDSGVTTIGRAAFEGCVKLKSVELPEGLTSIYENAFNGCSNLEEIAIPNSVTIIGDSAFKDCIKLAKVSIGDGVKSIGASAFYCCRDLVELELPDGLVSIGGSAFRYCRNLASVVIPSSVTRIGDLAFDICISLTDIYYGASKEHWENIEKDNAAIPDSATVHYTSDEPWSFDAETGTLTIRGKGRMEDIFLDTKWDRDGDTPWRDYLSRIKYVIIEDGVTSIAHSAFYFCEKMKGIDLPESITSIGEYAFDFCYDLTDIELPDNVTYIGRKAFEHCYSLTTIELPGSMRHIEFQALASCANLTDIVIADGVESIGDHAFANCGSLKNITIPASVTSVGDYILSGCKAVKNIYYGGTQEQWEALDIYVYPGVTIHYNYTG